MDSIELQKRSKPSHGLIKLSIYMLLMETFFSFSVNGIVQSLHDSDFKIQAYMFLTGLALSGACASILAQYQINYYKSVKYLISLGVLITLPIFILKIYIEKDIDLSDKSTENKNLLTTICIIMSIICGLGQGFYLCGFFCYTSLLSKPGNNGKVYGTLILIGSLQGFVKETLKENAVGMPGFAGMFWILLVISLFALSLGNPEGEREEIQKIDEAENITDTIYQLTILIPASFSSSYAAVMLNYGFNWINHEAESPPEEKLLNSLQFALSGMGAYTLAALWDSRQQLTNISIRVFIAIGILIHFCGYYFDMTRIMLVGYLILAVSARSLFIIPLAQINETYHINKLGGICVFIFWYYISNLVIAIVNLSQDNDWWLNYIIFFAIIMISIATQWKKIKYKKEVD